MAAAEAAAAEAAEKQRRREEKEERRRQKEDKYIQFNFCQQLNLRDSGCCFCLGRRPSKQKVNAFQGK